MNKHFITGIVLFLGSAACAETYYVNEANVAGEQAPYSTPATAATTIQPAVDQAADGDTVQVAGGYYVISSEILVTNDITIVSENGPLHTLVDGSDNSRCFHMTDAGTLSGFRIYNGNDYEGGGVKANSSTIITNCVFDFNGATYGGGLAGGQAYDCFFTNNTAYKNGGGIYSSGGNSAHNCTFIDNSADWNGGGMYGGYAKECEFIGNEAQVGGGICWGTARNSSFINNTAEYYGGGIYGDDGGKAYSCIFSNNEALVHGGGVDNAQVFDSLIFNNTSPDGGGAYDSILNNCTITENSAENGGGAKNCSLTNSIVWYNTASSDGDNIWITPGGISHCCAPDLYHSSYNCITNAPIFIDRAAGNFRLTPSSPCVDAGTINITTLTDLDGNPRLQNASMDMGAYETQRPDSPVYVSANTGNDSNDGQSWATAKQTIQEAIDIATDLIRVTNGVYLLSSEISALGAFRIVSENGPENTIVDGNGATRCFHLGTFSQLNGFTVTNGVAPIDKNGGGIYCDESITVVTNCIITSNSTTKYGGGMFNGTANNCTFENNSSEREGGGMCYGIANNCIFLHNITWLDGGGIRETLANQCTFINNQAWGSGGSGGGASSSDVKNSFFIGNYGEWGGGISDCNAINCTITGNSAYTGGGIYDSSAINCIIWNNNASISNNFHSSQLTYCACPDAINGIDGNITQDPLLTSLSSIATNSPCIGAGTHAAATGTDLHGEAWQNPPAIGCDEVVAGAVTGEIKLTLSGSTHITIETAGTYSTYASGPITQTILSFSDGISITNILTSVDHIWNVTGNQTVTFTAFNDEYPSGVTSTMSVSVLSAADSAIYVSDATGNDLNNGSSWIAAKKTIQAGVDAQIYLSGWVIISNGTYSVTNPVVADRAVHIKSLNGAEETLVKGPNYDFEYYRRCFDLNDESCRLSGFTITGGGVSCNSSDIIASNCLFTANRAYIGGGMSGGTAIECTFRENSSFYGGGGKAYGIALQCAFIDNSTVGDGGGLYEGTASLCTFVNNSALKNGGGMHGGLAYNSLFSGNSAIENGGGTFRCRATHCNLIGNSASEGGGASANYMTNCIVWYNEATVGDNLSGSLPQNCCSPDLTHEVDGNITNAPLLVSAAHIASNSPCIGKGNSDASSGTDLYGDAWKTPPAIGCDEVVAGSVTGEIGLSILGPANIVVGATGSYTPILTGGITQTILTFSDGASITNTLLPIQNIWNAAGNYSVSITAFNDEYPAGISFSLPVTVYSAEATSVYVSDTTGSDSNDGESWATAKQTIQAGVDAQNIFGGFVQVTNGNYEVTSEIKVKKSIQIISVNDPENTIVTAVAANRCFNLENSACTVSGFTITGGQVGSTEEIRDGGAIYCAGHQPYIYNCILMNNIAKVGGALYKGRVSHSLFSHNTAHYGGAISYSEVDNCVIINNTSKHVGGGAFWGHMVSCAIINNLAVTDGGGAYQSHVVNCTIADNYANNAGAGTFEGSAFNSIIWNNKSYKMKDIFETECYSCCSPTLTNNVNGNINNDPKFISRNNQNYRTLPDSPCINAGSNIWVNSSTDLDGNTRIAGGTVDMGAYEPISVYVSDATGNDVNDGSSWATAKKTLLAGVTAQQTPNGLVLVSGGTYLPTSEITATKPISIIAVDGAANTLVNGGGSHRCFNFGATASTLKGFTITNGFSSAWGGGIYSSKTDAVIEECIIVGNSAENGAGVAKCTLINCIIRGNHASNGGGGTLISIVNNCIITDNHADYLGGGMYGGTANNCVILNNSAYKAGGIYDGTLNNSILWDNSASNSSNELYNTTAHHSCSPALTPGINGNINQPPLFKNKAAGDYHLPPTSPCLDSGTNLYVETATDLDGETRIKNDVVDMGVYEFSAIYVATTGNDNYDGASWSKAKRTIQAGVDLAQNGDLVWVKNGTYTPSSNILVTNNITILGENEPENTMVHGSGNIRFDLGSTATTLSGFTISQFNNQAIYCTDLTPTITNCLISANSASSGAGLYKGTAIGCTFSNNTVTGGGGATYQSSVINCTFTGNSAYNGGAMYQGTATNCTFNGNVASYRGGATESTILYNCTLQDNSSKNLGGALYYGTANNCTLINNSAINYGGGIHNGTANNCALYGNSAYSGGGMYYGTANNCTFTQNSAFEGGGSNRTALNNCILWDNTAANVGSNMQYGTVRYSCAPELTHGSSGCITNNPLLISASHISTNSPCIGAGFSSYSSGTDIDGEAWQANPSMGCDEIIGSSVTGSILPILTTPERVRSGHTAYMQTLFEGAVSMTTLDFGDGQSATNMLSSISHQWSSLGNYAVVLTGYNDDHPSGISVTNFVYVRTLSATAIYVSDATGDDSNNGRSLATAKKTIQAGVDLQEFEGGVIYVDDGTYALDTEIVVDKNIIITSLNGAAVTTVEGNHHTRCFNLMNSRASIYDLTITHSGGYGEDTTGGAIYCTGTRPFVSNCIITENTGPTPSAMQGGTASNCSFINNNGTGWGTMKNGVAKQCTFNNNSSAQGGAIYDCVASDCTFLENAASYGGAMRGGKATRCQFIRNSATSRGGAVDNGTVINSTLQGNSAFDEGGGMNNGTAINCTFCDNQADNGGGMYGGDAFNCIFWDNTARIFGDNIRYTTARYSCAPELTHGSDGNITTNPQLISPSHIATNSPCIGAGSALYAEGSDIDGDSWNTPPAMGCDEVPPHTGGSIELSLSGSTNICAGFPANFTFIVEGEISLSRVQFGDGYDIYNPTTTTLSHTWDTPGSYVIRASAYNDNAVSQEVRLDIEVVDPNTSAIYVALEGNDSADGLSWTNAKETIQGGVDAQNLSGGQVIVSNGVYTLTETIIIEKEIQLIGLHGATNTIIDAVNLYDLNYNHSRAIEISDNSCSVDGFTIRNAYTIWTGGGLYCEHSHAPQISNCIFLNNRAGTAAGGMYGGTAISCIFTNCEALSGMGGGLYAGIATNSMFTQNHAQNGGGMYAGTANDCTFIANETGSSGGGLHKGTANRCTFKDNTAGHGGALCESTANDCTFIGNTALQFGGAMRDGTANRCLFVDNLALRYGGGIQTGTANNSLFIGNSANEGGGASYQATLNNCTVTGNSAEESGGGISHGTVNNCIVWNNTAKISHNNLHYGTIRSTCSPDAIPGSYGCITTKPQLISASHIASSSLCIGAGSASYSTATDIDGDEWLNSPSMGCDEPGTPPAGPVEMLLSGPTLIFTGVPANYTAIFNGPVNQTIVDFANGTRITNAVTPSSQSWSSPGSYDVILTAFNADDPLGTTYTQTIVVASSTIHVALEGSDTADGLSWATAKATIQAGADAQNIYGGEVLISNGVHFISAPIEINKPVHLIGLGDKNSFIDAGASNRCFNMGYRLSTLDNLVITNGAISTVGYTGNEGGGIRCLSQHPVITNCWISGCIAYKGGAVYKGTVIDSTLIGNTALRGGAMSEGVALNSTITFNNAEYGGGVYDGRVQRCLIYGNIASTDGGGLNYSTAQSCDIRNNTATAKGGGSSDSTLDNCTIVNNTANYAGGIYHGKANNCIVWYNHATTYTNMVSTTATFTCSPDAQQGSNGNITNRPVFYDWATGNYTLRNNSPCLNAGDNQYAAPVTDFNGAPRILHGIVDLGAYELNLGNDDTDGDGMPDGWELENFGNITIAVATNNPDSDPFENLDEYTAGTNPNDENSLLRITDSETIKNGEFTQTTLHWDAMEDRIYNILWTTNLVAGFQSTGFPDLTFPANHFIINNEHHKSFYKITVRLPD